MDGGRGEPPMNAQFLPSLSPLQFSEQLRQKRAKNGPHNSTRKPPRSNGLRRMSSSHTVSEDQSDDDDNTSTIGASTEPSVRSTCAACKAKDSLHWWKAPRGFDLSLPTLCDSCSMSWRKYAELKINRPEDLVKAKPAEKREGTPIGLPNAKRGKARFLFFVVNVAKSADDGRSLYPLNQAHFPKGRVLVVSDRGHMIPCSLATAVVSRFMRVGICGYFTC
jgi:DNA-directed RNA polymerase subunit M/transcription elongation factor TFIIS